MKKLFISIIVLLFIMLSYTCYASTFEFTPQSNKTGVNPGDEVFISMKISDITATDGINVVETTLNYDKSIIDSIEFIDKNEWKSTYNSNQGELYGKLLYTKMVTGVKDDEEIGVLKVKIKENLDQFKTDITFSQVTSNDGFELMNVGDKVVTLTYSKSQPKPEPKPEPEPDPEPQPKPPVPDEPSNEVTPRNEANPANNVEPKKDVPNNSPNAQTGDIIGFVCVILLIAIILSLVIFIISKKKKDDNK